MSSVVEEIEDVLQHYGMPRRSGRYPWGSGEDPYQHAVDFIGRVEKLRKAGFRWTDPKTGKIYTGDMAIARSMHLTSGQFRTEIGLAQAERKKVLGARINSMKEDGKGWTEIGRELGLSESTVRSLANPKSQVNREKAQKTADFLKARMKEIESEGGFLDITSGVELELGVSKERLKQAVYLLEREGYVTYKNRFEQVNNPGQFTTQKLLCPPGTEYKEVYDLSRVKTLEQYTSRDGGDTFAAFQYPASMDSKRIMVRYKDDKGADGITGVEKDGTIEIRRGVKDLSLGDDHYAQVRILVDGTHYLKGMAVYSDDLPDGVDVVFNTNKSPGVPMLGPKENSVLKPIKKDPDNPFGALIKPNGQSMYTDDDGTEKLSLINKKSSEGDWSEWQDALPSQFLGKQSKQLAKKQLDLAKADKQAEFDEYCSLVNPTIKKHLLAKFADECDSAAVHLQAAALPGQKYHVILPINTLKDNEVYAPGYDDGTELALIRYPHGGIFEIPILRVNNKNALGNKWIGKQSIDAVGINSKIAAQLSGADFDGDTVMCIPTNDPAGKVRIKNKQPLKDLEGFDAKDLYQADKVTTDPDGTKHYFRNGQEFRQMTNTGTQMGVISNLITDMTLGGASDAELARAVKHSMVVIDAEKHGLDYKQSEIDNGIAALHKKYQGKASGGAATILSKAKGQASVEKRQGTPKTNVKGDPDYDPSKPEGALIYKKADDLYYPSRTYNKAKRTMTIRRADGKKVTYSLDDKDAVAEYEPVQRKNPKTGEVYFTNRDGSIVYKTKTRTQPSTKMAEADDAYDLVSPYRHQMELIYADYANSMKALANQARLEVVTTGKIEYSASAKATYAQEVKDLENKLRIAELNAPRERAAQRAANVAIAEKKALYEDPKAKGVKKELKKAGQQALTRYRSEFGSVKRSERSIKITDREWEAIQAGAITESKLVRILNNTDVDELRQRATPRTSNTLSPAKVNKIKSMSASNYSINEIARSLGVSPSTVSTYLKGGK